MMDRQGTIIRISPRAPDPLCARLIREATIYFMELIDERDRQIADLKERLDPGNYCESCDYISATMGLQDKLSRSENANRDRINRLVHENDSLRMERMDAEDDRDRCMRKNKELLREKDRGW